MPTVVVTILIVLLAPYVLLASAAAVGFLAARRSPPPSTPSEWPSVTIVAPTADGKAIQETLQSCEYPVDRVEAMLPKTDGHNSTTESKTEVPGDVTLTLPAEAEVPPGWIRSMVRYCRSNSTAVGPTIIQHDDLFLPRLHALQHVGRLTVLGGLSHVGLPPGPSTANRAQCPDALPSDANLPSPDASAAAPTFNPEQEAAVTRPPAASFIDLLQEQAEWFRRALRSPTRLVQGQAVGLWLVHAVLLTCSVVAVAVPAWRQPTLLALLGKMGADVILTLPAASHFGQRHLLRSIVPTALMMVVTLPLAGGWALVNPSGKSHSTGDVHGALRES